MGRKTQIWAKPMMAAAALQAAIYAKLSADPTITALIGGPKIYERTPNDETFPYVTFGASASQDWSTGTEQGDEHQIILNVWSRLPSKKQALDISNAIKASLEAGIMSLAGHRLILFRTTGVEAAYEKSFRGYRATLRFEAFTEVI